MKKNYFKLYFCISGIICLTNASLAYSQTTPATPPDTGGYNLFLILTLIVLLHIVFIPLIFMRDEKLTPVETEPKKSAIRTLKEKLSGLLPIEQEKTILLNENYDGIMELDNKVPPWFNMIFYGTIIFAFIYLLDYHVLKTGKLPLQEYADEVNAAELRKQELIRTGALINENNVTLLTDEQSLASGKQIYTVNCVQCHGNEAQGIIGPNLTDQYWIHGGGVKNIFKTVKYGVPLKGMIAWQGQLNPKMIQQVVSYVVSLHGSNPPGAKAPEGNLYTETDSVSASRDSLRTESKKDSSDAGNKNDTTKLNSK